MDELKLVMKETTRDEGVFFASSQPLKKVIYQPRNALRRWGDMNNGLPTKNTHPSRSEDSSLIDQTAHQDFVGNQQIIPGAGLPLFQAVIGGKSVSNLLDLTGMTQYSLSIYKGGDLLQAQRVVLYRQRSLDGAYPISSPKPRGERFAFFRSIPADPF